MEYAIVSARACLKPSINYRLCTYYARVIHCSHVTIELVRA